MAHVVDVVDHQRVLVARLIVHGQGDVLAVRRERRVAQLALAGEIPYRDEVGGQGRGGGEQAQRGQCGTHDTAGHWLDPLFGRLPAWLPLRA